MKPQINRFRLGKKQLWGEDSLLEAARAKPHSWGQQNDFPREKKTMKENEYMQGEHPLPEHLTSAQLKSIPRELLFKEAS